jgi:hypothetical protein
VGGREQRPEVAAEFKSLGEMDLRWTYEHSLLGKEDAEREGEGSGSGSRGGSSIKSIGEDSGLEGPPVKLRLAVHARSPRTQDSSALGLDPAAHSA